MTDCLFFFFFLTLFLLLGVKRVNIKGKKSTYFFFFFFFFQPELLQVSISERKYLQSLSKQISNLYFSKGNLFVLIILRNVSSC